MRGIVIFTLSIIKFIFLYFRDAMIYTETKISIDTKLYFFISFKPSELCIGSKVHIGPDAGTQLS